VEWLIPPAAGTQVGTSYTVTCPTAHLTTAWLAERFDLARVTLEEGIQDISRVTALPGRCSAKTPVRRSVGRTLPGT